MTHVTHQIMVPSSTHDPLTYFVPCGPGIATVDSLFQTYHQAIRFGHGKRLLK